VASRVVLSSIEVVSLQPIVGLGSLFSLLLLYTVGSSPRTGRYELNKHRNPFLEWASNSQPQGLSGKR
jgi:hypothetical protein